MALRGVLLLQSHPVSTFKDLLGVRNKRSSLRDFRKDTDGSGSDVAGAEGGNRLESVTL